jgi:predicted RNA binding protein YcfA (HicA-like mRNA interferase family)
MNKRKLLEKLISSSSSPQNIHFSDLTNLMEAFGFVLARSKDSHRIYKHPQVRELLDLQDVGDKAKPYQIRQLTSLIEKYNLKLPEEPL